MTLRTRIVLTMIPLFVLLTVLGAAGVGLLYRLGNRVDAILRENYDSVIAMERLNEALERIDSSFQFAMAGQRKEAKDQYDLNWDPYSKALELEQHNITLPGERELVEELSGLTERYRKQGDAFYARVSPERDDYFGANGLFLTFKEIKKVSGQIRHINQDNMESASRNARRTALESLIWFGVGLAVAAVVAAFAVWHTVRSILSPIRAVTQSALGIGAGNLDQVVPVVARDELGQLAESFNTMARQLRQYRQTGYAQLLRAQRTSQATIDSFPHPVLVVDSEGRIELANPAARRVFGIVLEEAGNPSALPWSPPPELQAPLKEALLKQLPYLPEGFDRLIAFRTGDQDHSFLPRILPIQDPYGNTLGAAVLMQDVTRYRLLDEIKTDLVATVSHELKTPLTSIRLAVHLLLEETVGPLMPKQTELLLDARENAERLLARVNSLLDLARLEQNLDLLDRAPVKPEELLRSAADSVRPRAEDKQVEVKIEVPPDLPLVAVDAPRLAHALDNLLDNALTYTERGGRITLSAIAADDGVVLSIADTGVGIPLEHMSHIFEKFFRVPGQSQGGGTGLGLAIVREIVTAHGGTVSCESKPEEGTVFRIKLPKAASGLAPDPLAG